LVVGCWLLLVVDCCWLLLDAGEQVVDVGGQRNERKKWIHCFDDVKAILFIDNLAGYNRVLFEDHSKNMMKESLELFEQTVNNPTFRDTPVFLFLNKKDLFERMIRQKGLNTTFPEYDGPNDAMASMDFVAKMFRSKAPPGKVIEVQYVTGLWKRDVRCAFEEVKKKLLEQNAKTIEAERKRISKQQGKIEKQQNKINSKNQKGKCCQFSCCCCCSVAS
jgi:hypothetical protein